MNTFLLPDLSLTKKLVLCQFWATAEKVNIILGGAAVGSLLFWKSLSQPQSPVTRVQSQGLATTLPFQDPKR